MWSSRRALLDLSVKICPGRKNAFVPNPRLIAARSRSICCSVSDLPEDWSPELRGGDSHQQFLQQFSVDFGGKQILAGGRESWGGKKAVATPGSLLSFTHRKRGIRNSGICLDGDATLPLIPCFFSGGSHCAVFLRIHRF
jgi:hypothetical protein